MDHPVGTRTRFLIHQCRPAVLTDIAVSNASRHLNPPVMTTSVKTFDEVHSNKRAGIADRLQERVAWVWRCCWIRSRKAGGSSPRPRFTQVSRPRQQVEADLSIVIGRGSGAHGQVLEKRPAQKQARPMHARLDRGLLQCQDARDLRGREFCDVGEYKRQPKVVGKPRKRSRDGPFSVFPEVLVERTAPVGRKGHHWIRRRGQQGRKGFHPLRLSGSSSMPALTESSRDGIEPRRRIGAALELAPLPISLQQPILNQILRLVRTSAHPHANTKEARSYSFRNIREGKVAALWLSHRATGPGDLNRSGRWPPHSRVDRARGCGGLCRPRLPSARGRPGRMTASRRRSS